MYIPYHFNLCYWNNSSQMFEKSIWHLLVCMTQILLNLTFKSLNHFYDFISIFFHVSGKLKILTERFVLIHLNVSWLKDMRSNCNFTLNFFFINQPYWTPFTSEKISQLYIFRCECNMNIQRSLFSDFHKNFIKIKDLPWDAKGYL